MSTSSSSDELLSLTRVEPAMGTVFSITATAPTGSEEALTDAFDQAAAWLHEVDRRFTTYQPDSEWLRYAEGRIGLDDAHPDLRFVVARCAGLRHDTGGAFDIHADAGRPSDPAAFVKGWAIERAAEIVLLGGAGSIFLNGGGDIYVSPRDRPWRIAVQDPLARGRIKAVLEIDHGAVATSGTYERGEHISDPRTGRAATDLASVTVTGPELGLADALSTALFASGHASTEWFDDFDDYGAYLIDRHGRTSTRGRFTAACG